MAACRSYTTIMREGFLKFLPLLLILALGTILISASVEDDVAGLMHNGEVRLERLSATVAPAVDSQSGHARFHMSPDPVGRQQCAGEVLALVCVRLC